ncbi:hypothetical protein [Marinobacterium lutimaris]|uniref:Uncharacterized protein n=1 Tax=Marinobacterium lutimaris TaxID=568106 RepID=A0A1H5YGP0_9GAMM|nr:hypothetical protein [Marinobacterium lutimaris]SEG23243.1 hypothetical protein SAMN05444390_1011755 [Marinobacterium lutimaris]
MQKIAAAVILVLVLGGAYLFWSSDQQPAPTATDAETEVSPDTAEVARSHIETLTSSSAMSAIDVRDANAFVSGEQMLTLPGSAEQAAIEAGEESGGASTYAVDLGLAGTTADTSSSALSQLNRMRLKEILNSPESNPSDVFYIHSVDSYDRQGLWGIMQEGLTKTFAQGIKLSSNSRTLSTTIPGDADEKLADSSSSFLGHILDQKVKDSLIYNYDQGLLGQDPNLIQPGQQLLIIRFSEDELIRIYNYFAAQE